MDKDFVAATEDFLNGGLEAWTATAKFVAATWSAPAIAARTASTLIGIIVLVALVLVFRIVGLIVFLISSMLIIYAWIVTVHDLIRIVTCLSKILCFDVADMEKAVATHSKVNEGGLDAGLNIDDLALVNIANPIVLARSFRVEFFENSVFQ